MKSDHIQSALASAGEVAVFAWSLLELLLTRILPLLGYLTGHLLLQCFHFVSGAIFPSTAAAAEGRRHRLFREEEEEEEQQLRQQRRYGDVKPSTATAAAATRYMLEDIPDDYEQQPITSPTSQADAAPAAGQAFQQPTTVPLPTESHLPQVPQLNAQTAHPLPSAPPANAIGKQSVPTAASEPAHVAHAAALSDAEDKRAELTQEAEARSEEMQEVEPVAVKTVSEGNVGELTSSHGMESIGEEALTDRNVGEVGALISGRKGSMKRSALTRVLPPSFSQIKRTLMQRSRRLSSPLGGSSTPKPSSPHMKRRQSPRQVAKLASLKKSSASHDNVIRAYRKHFLLDSA